MALLLGAGLLLCAPAFAQPAPPLAGEPAPAEPVEAPAFAPGHWTLGDWSLTPQLLVAVGHNDNLRLQPRQAALASPFLALQPSLSVGRAQAHSPWQVSWRSEWTRFARSAVDSTLNTELAAEGMHLLDERSALAWRLAGQDWHDAVAQADVSLPAASPDHFRAVALGLVWRQDLGEAARHRLELEPTLSTRRYLNHRALTILADADTVSGVGRYLYALQPERRLGVEWRAVRARYPNSYQALSNVDQRALLVLQWEPTAVVHGTARAGWQQRRFDSLRPQQGLATWELDGQWQAGRQTLWQAGFTRSASDVPGDGADAVTGRRASLAWTQSWTPSSRSTLSVARSRNDFVNGFVPRHDRLRSLDLAWRADLSRRWQAGFNLGLLQRRSTQEGFDFSRRLGSLVLTAAL